MVFRALRTANIGHVILCVVGLGILLRSIRYVLDTSLWHDEILLALSLVRRSPSELFTPLDYGQVAPLLFILPVNLLTDLFGYSEWVFRLIPYLSSCLALVWFSLYARRYLAPLTGLVACCFLTFSPLFAQYSVTFKPYAVDLLVSVVLLHIFTVEQPSKRQGWIMLVALLFIPWLSFSSIFVICGLSAGFGVYYVVSREWVYMRRIMILGGIGIASFLFYYVLKIRDLSSSSTLVDFWEHAYFTSPYWSEHNVDLFLRGIVVGGGMVRYGYEFSVILGLSLVWGVIKAPKQTLPCVAVVGVTVCAAALHLYPFKERLLLFLSPFIVIILGQLVNAIRANHRYTMAAGLVLALLCSMINWNWNLNYALELPDQQQARAALEYVVDNQQNEEPILVVAPTDAFCEYYSAVGLSIPFQVLDFDRLRKSVVPLVESNSFWVVSESRRPDQVEFLQEWLVVLNGLQQENEEKTYAVQSVEFRGMLVLHLYAK